jgi:Holliday junction resolvasome RuvABC ATP-dependent DNA helicase subunit
MLDFILAIVVGVSIVAANVLLVLYFHARRKRLKARKVVPIPVAWQRNPTLAGDLLWTTIAQRCPELLGVAADRVLGRPVVDSLLKSFARAEPLQELENACPSVADPVESSSPEEVPKVHFKPGEPTSLAEYPGQPHVTTYLEALVNGTPADIEIPKEHQLFLGPPGQGKSLLTKCLAASLTARNIRLGLPGVRFMELVPADITTAVAQDAAIREACQHPTVLFIDEIHDLKEGHALKLYLLLEEGRYRFADSTELEDVSNIMVVAATTDYGALHGALKRRFNKHFLEPLSSTAIEAIVKRQPFGATEDAVTLVVSRTHFSGAPWEALQLYRQARVYAQGRGATTVETVDVDQALDAQALDDLGLNRMDRKVIGALLGLPRYRRGRGDVQDFVCYGAAESDVVAVAAIDKGEYRETIKPKLMGRGLLQVRATYGQVLTEKAVETYGWMKRVA